MDKLTTTLLLLFLAGAMATDLRAHRIPNALVLAGALAGLALAGLAPGGVGVPRALGGLALGSAMFLPMYVLHAMGAGDVKLMAMTGAFLGFPAIVEAALWVLLAGGVLALAFTLRRGVARRMGGNLREMLFSAAASAQIRTLPDFSAGPQTAARLPYAVAIGLGVGAFLLARRLGWHLI
ncbi:MAG: prepilin peptidase [Betaproteobacteria bacterium]|nr:prepilin peptidase [Betaproteobacteria bacterium]